MRFYGFQKITEASSAYTLTPKEQTLLFKQSKWVATEKVHGANFSIYHSILTGETKFAKRTGFLTDDDYFYGWSILKDSLSKQAADVAAYVRLASNSTASASSSPSPSPSYVILYGELCGGFYPSAESASSWAGPQKAGRINEKMQCTLPVEDRAVQEGIYYSPSLNFILFDVAVVSTTNDQNNASTETVKFLDFDALLDAAKRSSLVTPKPLIRGTFAQVSEFPYKAFDSTIAEQLGLHPLPKNTNRAEGIVIKPEMTIMIGADPSAASSGKKSKDNSNNDDANTSATGAAIAAVAPTRCLIKLKSPMFAEISSDYTEPNPTPTMRLKSLLNANRVASVLSKHGGRVTKDSINEVAQFMLDDILEDFYLRFPESAACVYGSEWDRALENSFAACVEALKPSMI